jgi:hypothetical protein
MALSACASCYLCHNVVNLKMCKNFSEKNFEISVGDLLEVFGGAG